MSASQMVIVYISTITTPLGRMTLAATGRGLIAVRWGGTRQAFLQLVRRRLPAAKIVEDDQVLKKAAVQIEDYLTGRRKSFSLGIEWRGMTPFQRRVLSALLRIPYGKVCTYGELARAIGRPSTARAVGRALGANPVLLVIPCHRVVAANGTPGGYSAPGGIIVKRKLLAMERGSR